MTEADKESKRKVSLVSLVEPRRGCCQCIERARVSLGIGASSFSFLRLLLFVLAG